MDKLIEEIKNSGVITEQQINLIKRRLNHKKYTYFDIQDLDLTDLKITPEQTKKGLDWLMNKWKTPRGIERKNNPFGYREESILETFKEFRFNSFHDNVNYTQSQMGMHNYQPIYDVIGEDGIFQYYVELGLPKIIGWGDNTDIKEFEQTIELAELKALSTVSLERELNDKEFKRMKELRDKLLEVE